jgi:hypothetical protein
MEKQLINNLKISRFVRGRGKSQWEKNPTRAVIHEGGQQG